MEWKEHMIGADKAYAQMYSEEQKSWPPPDH